MIHSCCVSLLAVDQAELAERQREEARNALEGYIYRLRDLLDESTSSITVFAEYSTPEERSKLFKLVDLTSEWLNEESDKAHTAEFQQKKEALQYVALLLSIFLSDEASFLGPSKIP